MDLTEDALRELARERRRELVSSRRKKKDEDRAEDAGAEGEPQQDVPEGDSPERTVVLPDTEVMDGRA